MIEQAISKMFDFKSLGGVRFYAEPASEEGRQLLQAIKVLAKIARTNAIPSQLRDMVHFINEVELLPAKSEWELP